LAFTPDAASAGADTSMPARNAAAAPLTQSFIKGMSLLLKSRDAPLIAQAHSCGNQRHRQSIQASNASIRAKQLWRDFGECGGNEAKLICRRINYLARGRSA